MHIQLDRQTKYISSIEATSLSRQLLNFLFNYCIRYMYIYFAVAVKREIAFIINFDAEITRFFC